MCLPAVTGSRPLAPRAVRTHSHGLSVPRSLWGAKRSWAGDLLGRCSPGRNTLLTGKTKDALRPVAYWEWKPSGKTWIFSLLRYTGSCPPSSPVSSKSYSRVCVRSPHALSLCIQPRLFLTPSLPSESLKHFSPSGHYCGHLFILISLHWKVINEGVWSLLSPPSFQGLVALVATWSTLGNEGMNSTEGTRIVCKTSCFSMCLWSFIWSWRCLVQSNYTNSMSISKGRASQGRNGRESPCSAGDTGDTDSTPGWGRCPGGGHGSPLQSSCLENPMDRGARQATVHGVAESDTTEATEHVCTHT